MRPKRIDGADVAVVTGLALLWVGLWMTVAWWAFVVIGGVLFGLGIVAALLTRPRAE